MRVTMGVLLRYCGKEVGNTNNIYTIPGLPREYQKEVYIMALTPVPDGYALKRIQATLDPDTNRWSYVGIYKKTDEPGAAPIPISVTNVGPTDAATPELAQNALTDALTTLVT